MTRVWSGLVRASLVCWGFILGVGLMVVCIWIDEHGPAS